MACHELDIVWDVIGGIAGRQVMSHETACHELDVMWDVIGGVAGRQGWCISDMEPGLSELRCVHMLGSGGAFQTWSLGSVNCGVSTC
jgi:hypothetical protein